MPASLLSAFPNVELRAIAPDAEVTFFAKQADLEAGISKLRGAAKSLGANVTFLQTRLDFTKQYVNNLSEGADKLTLSAEECRIVAGRHVHGRSAQACCRPVRARSWWWCSRT